jgi:hypothetical protein
MPQRSASLAMSLRMLRVSASGMTCAAHALQQACQLSCGV